MLVDEDDEDSCEAATTKCQDGKWCPYSRGLLNLSASSKVRVYSKQLFYIEKRPTLKLTSLCCCCLIH